MGQYTIKDVESRAEALKNDVDNIYRALNDKLGSSPETLDQVPEYILSIPDLPTEEPLTITPTIDGQEISAFDDLKYNPITVEPVTSAIDSNIQPENIKEGVTILGVEGTLKEEKPEEVFNVQPTTTEQTITPTAGSVFSGGTVHAVTSAIDSNIQPENIKEGVSILGVAGTLSGGGGSDVYVVPDGTKFGGSTFTELPLNCDFSNVIDMSNMFNECKNLTTVSQLNVSNAILLYNTFTLCDNLTSIPQLDFSSATNVAYMFYGCTSLPAVHLINMSKVSNMTYMFSDCIALTTVEGIDFSGLTEELKHLCGYGTNRSKLTRFIVKGKINVSISDEYGIKALTAIDYDSVKSILAAADRTDNTNAKTLAFNRTMTDQNGELAALVASCTSKGWTITGLTLQ